MTNNNCEVYAFPQKSALKSRCVSGGKGGHRGFLDRESNADKNKRQKMVIHAQCANRKNEYL